MNHEVRFLKNAQALVADAGALVAARPRPMARSITASQVGRWGWLPVLSVIGALGLLLVALANALSRLGVGEYESLLWTGVLLLFIPFVVRLVSTAPERRERLGLVVLLVLGLYLVKVFHSPNEFIFSDELLHLHNAISILQTGRLFNDNSILAVTPLYPGMETLTAALASLSGLSAFSAGLVIIGVARVILGLALFLLYEEVSGSARVAGLAALIYATNANFLYWSAQFSYESLALPVAVLVLFMAVRLARTDQRIQRIGLIIIIVAIITAIVITHHLTSYFIAIFFIVWALLCLFMRIKSRRAGSGVQGIALPAALAAFSTIAVVAWLVTVASYTVGYLSPVLGGAIQSIIQIIIGEETSRQLFQSTTGYVAPVWERMMGLGSVVVLLLGLPIGLRQVWRHFRHHPVALILAAGALSYFAMLGLRFSPAAWETGNRASEFLFIGLAFILALTVVTVWDARRAWRVGRVAIIGGVVVIVIGGVIAGWSPSLRLGRPLQVTVGGVTIKPQGFTAADWMKNVLGPGHIVATDESNARLLLAYGQQSSLTGGNPDIRDLLGMADFPDWQAQLIQEHDIRYLVVDRRAISWNNMEGYYFDATGGGPIAPADLIAPDVTGKFDQLRQIPRIYDSGNLTIYDTKAILNAAPIQ